MRRPQLTSVVVSVALVGLGGSLAVSGAEVLEQTPDEPVTVDCAKWLAHPSTFGRWVRLEHCRLDAGDAVSRRWRYREKDRPKRTMVLFLPVLPASATERGEIRAVVATRDPKLLAFVDRLGSLPGHESARFLEEHAEAMNERLTPPALTGLVHSEPPDEAREALTKLEAPTALVLEEGHAPDSSDAQVELGAAVVFVALAIGVLFIRADEPM